MSDHFVRLPLVNRSIRLVYLLLFSIILIGSVGAYAASVTINPSINAGYQGEYVVDNGYYLASAISYNVVEAAQAASASGLAWSNGGTMYVNALVAGDWEVAWTITIEGGLTSHAYTITVTSTSAAGTTSTVYTFIFTSPATITTGQTMTVLWDTSAITWTAPAAIQVTVA